MKTKVLAITLTVLLTLALAMALVSATSSVSFQDFEGNYTNSYTVDPPEDKIIYLNNDGTKSNVVTDKYVVFDVSDDGTRLSFQATGILVYQIFLKGGEHYRIYSFLPDGVTEANDLVCPLNHGGNIPQISHYGLIEVGIPTETTTTGTTTGTTAGTTTTGTTTTGTTTTGTTTTTATSTTAETTTITTTTTAGTTSTQPSQNTVTETTNTTPTTTSEIPTTGEIGNSGPIIGIILLGLATALYFILHKKPSIS